MKKKGKTGRWISSGSHIKTNRDLWREDHMRYSITAIITSGSIILADQIQTGERCAYILSPSSSSGNTTPQHVHDAGDHKYRVHHGIIAADGGSRRYILGYISGGIRQERQQAGQSHPDDDGNSCRGSRPIVYGLFGYILFVITLGWSYSRPGRSGDAGDHDPATDHTNDRRGTDIGAGFRPGKEAFGLGAGKLRTVFKIILPCAVPGILAGVILAIGRIVGEKRGIDIYIRNGSTGAGQPVRVSKNAVGTHVRTVVGRTLYEEAYATAVVLLVLVILINGFRDS